MSKLTDNELQRIQLVKKDALEIASSLGELQYQKITIDLLIEEETKKIKINLKSFIEILLLI